ncbi:WD repeat domain phosphoinositide-interacting protein 2-like [Watersipora subatra]|uniref:WD repeat domain phosphoinositide-interacting protein 2-like n=1 Tax=Watersipora subatra TaxID=2589382 RepID=UPI00355C40E2
MTSTAGRFLEDEKRLGYVGFNQDSSSLSVGTRDGYQLYSLNSIDKLELIHSYVGEKDLSIVARLFSSSLIAVVSLSAPRKLKVCHFKKDTEICNYSYSNSILSVKLNRQRLVVCLEESIYIHNIKDMKVIHTISSTSPNPAGICDLTPNERSYLAYPSTSQAGTLQIFDTETLKPVSKITAHDNPLAAMSFDSTGCRIATASEKGTVIRVFSVPDGAKLWEFRRGVKRCVTISTLAFSSNSLYLAASSNTETVHIFKLEKKEESTPVEETQSWAGYFTSALKSSAAYLPTPVTDVINQFRAFATCKLEHSGQKTICALPIIQKMQCVLAVSETGTLYVYTIDPLEGGECHLVRKHIIGGGSLLCKEETEERPLACPSKTGTKSSSDSPPSDSQSYQDVEPPGGSPSETLKLDDDSEFPPMSQEL